MPQGIGLNVVACPMAAVPLKAQIVREALRGLGAALDGLSRPPTELPDGNGGLYAMGMTDNDRLGIPPQQWPEVVEVSEALMGAALLIAHEHVGNATTAQVHHDIEHLANYWKHRGDWGGQWQSAHRHTLAGIKALNGGSTPTKSPVTIGQLSELAEKALKTPFTTDALWAAIADVP